MDAHHQPRYGIAVSTPSLLGQVLGITAAAFIITAASAYLLQGISYGLGMAAMLAGLILIFVISGVRANQGLALLLFYVFAALEGAGLAPVISSYVARIGSGAVAEAALTTGVGMALLAAIVYTTAFDFRKLSGLAFGVLIALVVLGILGMFVRVVHPATYAWLTLIVFSVLVLVDFARIRAGGDGFTPVQMALSIYLDAINIFLALLELAGMRNRDD